MWILCLSWKTRMITSQVLSLVFLCYFIFTARKRSLRRLCFYTCLSVILFTGGMSASVHDGINTPPGSRHPWEADSPWEADPPANRHHPPPREADPPPRKQTPLEVDTPPWEADPPCAVHAGRYGQQAGGAHPTGIHTCFTIILTDSCPLLFHCFSAVTLNYGWCPCKWLAHVPGLVWLFGGNQGKQWN